MNFKPIAVGIALALASAAANATLTLTYTSPAGTVVSNDGGTGSIGVGPTNLGFGWSITGIGATSTPVSGTPADAVQSLDATAKYTGASVPSKFTVLLESTNLFTGPVWLGVKDSSGSAGAAGTTEGFYRINGGAWTMLPTASLISLSLPAPFTIDQMFVFTATTPAAANNPTNFNGSQLTFNAPEPGTMAALGLGLAAMGLFGTKRRRTADAV